MRIIQNTTEVHLSQDTVVAMGKFDGVHVGHRKLIDEILRWKKQGFVAVIFTFDPSPEHFFGWEDDKELTTREEKRAIFKKLGIDILIEFPFNNETAAILPEQFISDVLVEGLRARHIVAGTDVSFGKEGRGNLQSLQALETKFDYRVHAIEKACIDGAVVSSSRIRSEILQGNMPIAAKLLGTSYQIEGRVEHGMHMGTGFGMPTVNIIPDETKLLPPFGVYYSEVHFENRVYQGITNIGIKPTVTYESKVGVETYIYDFNKTIYGENISISLLEFSRKEQKFADVKGLKRQLEQDMQNGMIFHKHEKIHEK